MLSRLLPKELKQLKFETTYVGEQYLGCHFTKFQLKLSRVFRHALIFPGVSVFFPVLL